MMKNLDKQITDAKTAVFAAEAEVVARRKEAAAVLSERVVGIANVYAVRDAISGLSAARQSLLEARLVLQGLRERRVRPLWAVTPEELADALGRAEAELDHAQAEAAARRSALAREIAAEALGVTNSVDARRSDLDQAQVRVGEAELLVEGLKALKPEVKQLRRDRAKEVALREQAAVQERRERLKRIDDEIAVLGVGIGSRSTERRLKQLEVDREVLIGQMAKES